MDRQHGIVRIPIEEAKKIALGSNVYTLNNGLQQSPGGAEVILGAQRGTQQKVPVTPGQAVTPAPLPGATTTGGAQ